MRVILSVLIAFVMFSTAARAELKLAAIFADDMMLQQKADNAVWGWADANARVTIQTSWLGEPVHVTADQNGAWKATLPVPAADLKAHTITVTAGTQITIHNVLFGEIWLCSGQSNMAMKLRGNRNQPVLGSNDAIARSRNPHIRQFEVKLAFAAEPKDHCEGQWSIASPNTAGDFIAVGYFFAELLNDAMEVPVGIINTTWGGTPVEAWMDRELLEEKYPYVDLSEVGTKAMTFKSPTTLYNAMIHPLEGYRVRGMLWYQGESNVRQYPDKYIEHFPAMITRWRERWGQGDFPFYYAQIAPNTYRDGESWLIREQQLKTMEAIPNVGMATLSDIGSPSTIHPPRKREVGQRLAHWALNKTYGQTGVACGGPYYKAMDVKEGVAYLEFDNAPQGLTTFDQELTDFWIAGEDQVFHPAQAAVHIEWDVPLWKRRALVSVRSEQVPHPVAVRYGWSNFFVGTLYDTAGVPASSFRTDDWDGFKKAE